MIAARSMQPDSLPFSEAQTQFGPVPLLFHRSVRSVNNTLASTSIEQLESQIAQLKAHYEFIHPDEISTFLERYPFLIADLKTIHEIKSRYFGEAPMTLYYIDETGWIGGATLAAYIQADMPREKAQELFSQFDEEWWEQISEEAKHFIMVDRECTHV
jgi:hypothetical protein